MASQPESISARTATTERLTICLVSSHGGHLTELLELQEVFEGHDTFYFSYDAATTRLLKNACLVPNHPYRPWAYLRNLRIAYRLFKEKQPDLVVTTGAEVALPVVAVAKWFKVPVIYIECSARSTRPSVTGRILYWFADEFYAQWPELVRLYGPRAKFRGSLIDQDDPVHGDRSDERRLKAALVQPAHVGAFSSDQPPMGLAYIASVLEQHGCEVRIIDANVERLAPEDVVALIRQQRANLVGITVTTPLLPSALAMARALRSMDPCPTLVAGGPHATVLPEELLEPGTFDYVIRGEGEDTMGELVEHIIAGEDADGVAGVSWRRDGEIVHNPGRTLNRRLEDFPYPDWSLFPLKRYSSLARRNDFCLPITTSRGCPHECSFCYKGVYGHRLRMRSPEDVVDEWQYLVERYGAKEIAVLDDVFTFNRDRAIAICDLLVERGLNRIPWSTTNGIRVDNVTPELMSAMRRAGCYRVYFGIESGVQRIIDQLNKHIRIDQVREAVRLAKEAGLEVGGYFMLGNLGETAADMDATIDFALSLDTDLAQFTIATPYPGTEMHRKVLEEGELLIQSWSDLATYGNLTFRMGELTPELVDVKYRRALRAFYLRPRFVLKQLRQLTTWTGIKHQLGGLNVLLRMIFGGANARRKAGETV